MLRIRSELRKVGKGTHDFFTFLSVLYKNTREGTESASSNPHLYISIQDIIIRPL